MLGLLELTKFRDFRLLITLGKFQAAVSCSIFFTPFCTSPHLGSGDAHFRPQTVAVPTDLGALMGHCTLSHSGPLQLGSIQFPRTFSCLTHSVVKPFLVLSFISDIIILRPRVPISFLCFVFLC